MWIKINFTVYLAALNLCKLDLMLYWLPYIFNTNFISSSGSKRLLLTTYLAFHHGQQWFHFEGKAKASGKGNSSDYVDFDWTWLSSLIMVVKKQQCFWPCSEYFSCSTPRSSWQYLPSKAIRHIIKFLHKDTYSLKSQMLTF
jgi:hypothetical protein